MMRRLILFVILAAVLPAADASAQQRRRPTTTTITILQVNDVYELSPVDGYGGLARLSAMVSKEKDRNPGKTLLLMSGDFISPSIYSPKFKGKQMIEALNAAGLDIATLGNHEFDYSTDVLRERMKESRFQYTSANVFDKATRKLFGGAQRYIMRDMGGVKVAIFGLLTTETLSDSSLRDKITITDPIKVGAAVARELRRRGADLVIALSHLSMCDDKRLAAVADVDLIIGGHEHELLQSMAGRTHISKMGSDARYLGRMDLHLSRTRAGRPRLKYVDWASLPVDDSIEKDQKYRRQYEQVKAVVDGWEQKLNAAYAAENVELDKRIGDLTVELDAMSGHVRRFETNLGDLFADAYRHAFKNDLGVADVALINSGGIRSDRTYGREGATTELRVRDIYNILQFANKLVMAELKGEDIKQLLEHGVSRAGEEVGRFPQVSGVRFAYDASRPAGSRVTSVEIGGQPYDPAKTYKIVVNDFLYDRGGDDYKIPQYGKLGVSTRSDRDLVIDYIEAMTAAGEKIAPVVDGRIKSAQPAEAPPLDPCAAASLLPRPEVLAHARRRMIAA
jgi:2',3'-cyclic-nucleotide 2'-phosphodiesterase (5'-nucleotidase family)